MLPHVSRETSMPSDTRRISGATLLLVSVVYALTIVWGVEWLLDALRSRTFGMGPELQPRWVRTALALAPFALFSLWVGIRRPPAYVEASSPACWRRLRCGAGTTPTDG